MELQKGKAYDVIVTKILQRGIIVQIEDSEDTEFIHISKLSTKYVSDISQIVNVGSTYTAIGVYDDVRNKVGLSLKHVDRVQYTKDGSKVFYRKDFSGNPAKQKSLDDMIAAADSTLREKQRAMGSNSYIKPRGRRRNNRNGKGENY